MVQTFNDMKKLLAMYRQYLRVNGLSQRDLSFADWKVENSLLIQKYSLRSIGK